VLFEKGPSRFDIFGVMVSAPRPFKDTSDVLERGTGLEKYSYHEGFEGTMPDVKLWASNGECKINYLGPASFI